MTLQEKQEAFIQHLKQYHHAAVAFSGGVDSAFLLKAAQEALENRIVAVTVNSRVFPKREADEAAAFCRQYGIRQILVPVDELSIEGFAQNPANRCYLCKRELFGRILHIAKQEGMDTVLEGSNLDDEKDYRPGRLAIAELGIKSPLSESGMTKAQIRLLSRQMGLPTWDKQSFACLASRFVYGETITEEKLTMVDKAEQKLYELGFQQFRVRIHGSLARIEVMPEDFKKLAGPGIREQVAENLRQYGFTYVTMDLNGYRTGSMNEAVLHANNEP